MMSYTEFVKKTGIKCPVKYNEYKCDYVMNKNNGKKETVNPDLVSLKETVEQMQKQIIELQNTLINNLNKHKQ